MHGGLVYIVIKNRVYAYDTAFLSMFVFACRFLGCNACVDHVEMEQNIGSCLMTWFNQNSKWSVFWLNNQMLRMWAGFTCQRLIDCMFVSVTVWSFLPFLATLWCFVTVVMYSLSRQLVCHGETVGFLDVTATTFHWWCFTSFLTFWFRTNHKPCRTIFSNNLWFNRNTCIKETKTLKGINF